MESLEYSMDGDVDLHGFLNLSKEIRPGFQGIRVRARVKAEAPGAKIQELLEYAAKTSPVMDTFRKPRVCVGRTYGVVGKLGPNAPGLSHHLLFDYSRPRPVRAWIPN